MNDWKTCSIEPELCEIIAGGTPPTGNKDYWNGEVLWITPADMSKVGRRYISNSERRITVKGVKYSTGKLMPVNSVIISCRAPVGYCVMATEPFATNQGCKTLLCKNVEPGYLYYYLLNSTQELVKVSSGTTFLELSKRELARFQIRMPSDLPTQRKIVEVLESIEDVIDRTKETIAKYRNLKIGVLEDFVKVGSNGYPDLLNTSKPVIAKEWKFRCLDELTSKIADRDHTTPIYVKNDGILIVSPKDFDDENIDFSNCKMISLKAHLINRKRTDIEPGDLIFTRIGAGLGKVCLVTEDMPEFSILHSAAMIRTNSLINNRYLVQIIRSFYFQKQISMGIQSIGVPDLGMDKIKELMILYPSDIKVQEHIADVLEEIDNNILNEKTHLKKTSRYKKRVNARFTIGRS